MSDSRGGEGRRAWPRRKSALLLWLVAAVGLYLASLIWAPLRLLFAGANVQLQSLAYNLIYYLPFLALPLILRACRYPEARADLRANPLSPLRAAGIALLALLGVFFFSNLLVLWAIPLQELGFDVNASAFPTPQNTRELALCVITVAVIPAICEETLFRGALLPALEPEGTRRAVCLCALLFAMLHGSLTGLPSQFLLGAIMAMLVIDCDSIYAGLTYHTVHNAALIILQYLQRGAEPQNARLLDAIGGASGVVSLLISCLMNGAVMLMILKAFRRGARLRGVETFPRTRKKLTRGEVALVAAGVVLALALYGLDVADMLHLID